MDKNVKILPEINKRFLKILEIKGYTGYKLSLEVPEISQAKITSIRTGRNRPSADMIQLLTQKFPDISKAWLLAGEGALFNTKIDAQIHNLEEKDSVVMSLKNSIAQKDELLEFYTEKIKFYEEKIKFYEEKINNNIVETASNTIDARVTEIEKFVEAARLKLIVGSEIDATKEEIKKSKNQKN